MAHAAFCRLSIRSTRARWAALGAFTICALPHTTYAQRASAAPKQPAQPTLAQGSVPLLTVHGLRFRDLNRDGTLQPFEDWRRSSSARAADLVNRMTVEEKAGTAVHGTAPIAGGPMSSGPAYDSVAATAVVVGRSVTSLITRMSIAPAEFANANNQLQRIAERGRFSIPITISTDPRNHFQVVGGASVAASGFSQWPETLGFGALDEPALVRRFATIIRREYRAVGIHMALSPQADLATEPRWARITGTFGEDPVRVGELVRAYVEAQGGAVRVESHGGHGSIFEIRLPNITAL